MTWPSTNMHVSLKLLGKTASWLLNNQNISKVLIISYYNNMNHLVGSDYL